MLLGPDPRLRCIPAESHRTNHACGVARTTRIDNGWVPDTPAQEAKALWTRALASEIFTNPVMPLDHDLVLRGSLIPAWSDQLVDEHGVLPSEIGDGRPGLVALFGGYAYINASLLRLWAARMPVLAPDHLDRAYLGQHPDLPPTGDEARQECPEDKIDSLSRWLQWVLVDGDQSTLESDHRASLRLRSGRPDLAVLGDQELFDHLQAHLPLCRRLFAEYLAQTLAASIGPGIVSAICHDIEMPAMATRLIAGLGEVESVAPAQVLWSLSRVVRTSPTLTRAFDDGRAGLPERIDASSRIDVVAFRAGLEVILSEVGFMGPAEWELASPSWESDPSLMLSAIDWMRQCGDDLAPSIGFSRQEADRTTMVKEVGDIIASRQGTPAREQFAAAVVAAGVFVRGRERAKTSLSRVVNEMRLAILELGERAAIRGDVERPGDVHFLFAEELESYASGGLATIGELVESRRAAREEIVGADPAFVIDETGESRPVALLAAMFGDAVTTMVAGEVLLGSSGAAGRARGTARIVSDAAGCGRVEPGDIVVTTATSAAWLPYAIGMSGLVIDAGTLLSSPAVIGREIGVPVVVGALDATERVPDGALIEVDGETGIVTLIEV